MEYATSSEFRQIHDSVIQSFSDSTRDSESLRYEFLGQIGYLAKWIGKANKTTHAPQARKTLFIALKLSLQIYSVKIRHIRMTECMTADLVPLRHQQLQVSRLQHSRIAARIEHGTGYEVRGTDTGSCENLATKRG